jgi:ceramide glucosyltransferase
MIWALIRDALLLAAIAPFAYYALAIFAAARFFHSRSPVLSSFTPPVSILKPIRGLDRETYENFASFCRQDYPEFEILFCVSDENEPAITVIEQIMRDFPQRSIRLLIGSEPLGVSDKVNKLCRMAREARHDILVVTDSDVRVAPDFLRGVVGPFGDPKVAGVTCLYRGLTDGSLAADLEALGNSTDFAPGVLTAWLLGDLRFMLGAVMATTKRHLAEIGGFEALVNHFSDDYELGHRMATHGYRIALDRFPVSIVYPRQNLAEAFRHQVRWNLAIRCSRPWGHAGIALAQGLPWALIAAAIAPGWGTAAVYLACYAVLRVAVAWVVGVSGMQDNLAVERMWMLPFRDAFAFVAWVGSFVPQRIHWRGHDYYVREKRLVPVPSRDV